MTFPFVPATQRDNGMRILPAVKSAVSRKPRSSPLDTEAGDKLPACIALTDCGRTAAPCTGRGRPSVTERVPIAIACGSSMAGRDERRYRKRHGCALWRISQHLQAMVMETLREQNDGVLRLSTLQA